MGKLDLYAQHPVSENDAFTLVMDEFRDERGDSMLVVHIDFHKFSKSALKRCLAEWRVLRACVTLPIFAYPDVDDVKWERFVRLHGFQHLSFIPCTDGKTRRLFVSYPEDPIHALREENVGLVLDCQRAVGSAEELSA